MKNKTTLIYFIRIATLLLLLFASKTYAQVTLIGQQCVMSGTEYSYQISGNWANDATMQVCINGGIVAGTVDSCTANSLPLAMVNVAWSNITGPGKITLSSNSGNASIDVKIISPLQPGIVDSLNSVQSIGYNNSASQIGCGPATGGSCSPSYNYQWQISINNILWEPVNGAIGLNLDLPPGLTQTTYVRRKVVETLSGIVAYSNSAIVFVAPDLTGHN